MFFLSSNNFLTFLIFLRFLCLENILASRKHGLTQWQDLPASSLQRRIARDWPAAQWADTQRWQNGNMTISAVFSSTGASSKLALTRREGKLLKTNVALRLVKLLNVKEFQISKAFVWQCFFSFTGPYSEGGQTFENKPSFEACWTSECERVSEIPKARV